MLKMFLASPPAVAPRRQPRGLPGDAIPNEVRRDAVPNEARDASLLLGRTGEGLLPRAQARGPLALTRQGMTNGRLSLRTLSSP